MSKFYKILTVCLVIGSFQIVAGIWEDFRVTFNPNIFGNFNRLPRTLTQWGANEWALVSRSCANNGQFNGFQYMIPGDISAALLFDVNGVIAGIQVLLDKSIIQANNTFNYEALSPMYQTYIINGKEYFMLTTYFVHPAIICTIGRAPEDLGVHGTGHGLWIQEGPTWDKSVEVPYFRIHGFKEYWTRNNCVPGMGSHNFYRAEELDSIRCSAMRPIFALYNLAGEMHGFGFFVPGVQETRRFEKPNLPAIRAILGNTPQCIVDISNTIGWTSFHVFFVDTPWAITC